MDDNIKNSFEQAAALQKMWMDTISGMTEVWGQYSPDNPPPEELKKARQGILRVISKSWEEFMRTPQFMQMMRDSVNNAIAWQGYAKEGGNRFQDAMQAASKEDVDGLLLAIRHVEKRNLDQLEALQESIEDLARQIDRLAKNVERNDHAAVHEEIISRLASLEKKMATAPRQAPAKAARKTVAKKTPKTK